MDNQQLQAMLAQMQGQAQPPMMQPVLPQVGNDQLMQTVLMQLQQLQQMVGVLLQAHYEREQRHNSRQGRGYGNRYGGGYGGGGYGGNRYGGGR